jgi:hypothetical protein
MGEIDKKQSFYRKKRGADLSQPAPPHPLPKSLGNISLRTADKVRFIENPIANTNRNIKTAMSMPTLFYIRGSLLREKCNFIQNIML